jgi:UDP-N-acetylmuramoyl-tripeptide--D-alanyl-D-alanine ligase
MGANHPGEIATLCGIARPGYGIITNIGKAHLAGFGSLQNVIETKTALYRSVAGSGGKLFINADDALLTAKARGMSTITYGRDGANDCPGKLLTSDPFVTVAWGRDHHMVSKTRLVGSYNYENILAAVCTGRYFGVDENEINDAVERYEPSNMRSQFLDTGRNVVILDAYNANPTSLAAAIDHFAMITGRHKIAIIGDMLELGASEDAEHLEVIRKLKEQPFDRIILVGPVFMKVNPCKDILCFNDPEAAGDYLRTHPPSHATILLKGSRGIQMEKILDKL